MNPLTHGSVLIAGVKISAFSDEIRNHPRIILWDNENEKWASKNLPVNVQAVITTRWIGHSKMDIIRKEARKRKITIFPCLGTGEIVRHVKELLNMNSTENGTNPEVKVKTTGRGKLESLIPLIDFNKSNVENGKILYNKAQELGIETTVPSVAQLVSRLRNKDVLKEIREPKKLDVTVEMLDSMIKQLEDMRDFLIAVNEENRLLKMRIANFKKMLDGETSE